MEEGSSPASPETCSDNSEVPVSFSVPLWVVEGRGMTPDDFARWVRVSAALYRYGRSEISLGTAAALAGMSQAAFMRVLKEAQQDTFVIDWDDLDRELVRAGVIPAPFHDDAG